MRTLLSFIILGSICTLPHAGYADDFPEVVAEACRAQCAEAPPTPAAIPGEHHNVELQVPGGTQNLVLEGNTLSVSIFTDGSNVVQTAEFELRDDHELSPSNIVPMGNCQSSRIQGLIGNLDAEALYARDGSEVWESNETPATFHAFDTLLCAPRGGPSSLGFASSRRATSSRGRTSSPHGLVCDDCEAWWASQGMTAPEPEQLADTYSIEIVSSSTVASN